MTRETGKPLIESVDCIDWVAACFDYYAEVAGTFWVNDPLTDNDVGPFGGMRWSGIGRDLGEEGRDPFREPKHVHLDYIMERKSYWYPYRDRPIPPGQ